MRLQTLYKYYYVLCVRTEYCGPTLIIIGPELGSAY